MSVDFGQIKKYCNGLSFFVMTNPDLYKDTLRPFSSVDFGILNSGPPPSLNQSINQIINQKVGRSTMVSVNVALWVLGGVSGLYCLISDGVRLFKEDSYNVYKCQDKSSPDDRKIYFLVVCSFQVVVPLCLVTLLSAFLIRAIQRNASNDLLKVGALS